MNNKDRLSQKHFNNPAFNQISTMKKTINLSKSALIGASICIMIVLLGSCSLLEAFDSKAHIRFKNNTAVTFNGVRVNGGAEFDGSFAPSAQTGYSDNDAGNFGVDVKIGSVWTFVNIPDGNSLSISTGSKYTVSINGTAGNYTAIQVKD